MSGVHRFLSKKDKDRNRSRGAPRRAEERAQHHEDGRRDSSGVGERAAASQSNLISKLFGEEHAPAADTHAHVPSLTASPSLRAHGHDGAKKHDEQQQQHHHHHPRMPHPHHHHSTLVKKDAHGRDLAAPEPDRRRRSSGGSSAGGGEGGDRDGPYDMAERARKRLKTEHGIRTYTRHDIAQVLKSQYVSQNRDAHADPVSPGSPATARNAPEEEAAYDFCLIAADSEEGLLRPFDPDIEVRGAVNRSGCSCYLDALLFAMFARLASFEAMLYLKGGPGQDGESASAEGSQAPLTTTNKAAEMLSTLLRLWVNLLRSGRLITTDITKQIQEQLAACGWEAAAELVQHDSSEAFSFITETLALPLLTLKMDIFHTGREDVNDDHKFVNERLLELAVPEDDPADGHVITLEDCLEMYFNNKIEVRRHLDSLERRNTAGSSRSRALTGESSKAGAVHLDVAELPADTSSSENAPPGYHGRRSRGASIIQDQYFDEKAAGSSSSSRRMSDGSRRARFNRKEVMMPAWQFFSLIPWYTNNKPTSDAQVAAHFSKTRPILGICLKRYGVSPDGKAFKRRTHIDIPLEIALPQFISDDAMRDNGPAFGNFKLSLRSVVCHQGVSVESGHYVSFAREANLFGGEEDDDDDKWLKFDDLASERVVEIDITNWLKRESPSPYLLFYQVVPIDETDALPPPSYADSTSSKDLKADLSLYKPTSRGDGSNAATSIRSSEGRPSTDVSKSLSADDGKNERLRAGVTGAPQRRASSQLGTRLRKPLSGRSASRPQSYIDGGVLHASLAGGEGPSSGAATPRDIPVSRSSSTRRLQNRLSASFSRISMSSRSRSRDNVNAVSVGGDPFADPSTPYSNSLTPGDSYLSSSNISNNPWRTAMAKASPSSASGSSPHLRQSAETPSSLPEIPDERLSPPVLPVPTTTATASERPGDHHDHNAPPQRPSPGKLRKSSVPSQPPPKYTATASTAAGSPFDGATSGERAVLTKRDREAIASRAMREDYRRQPPRRKGREPGKFNAGREPERECTIM